MELSILPHWRCCKCDSESRGIIEFKIDPDRNIPQYEALSYNWGDETMMGFQERSYLPLSRLKKDFEVSRLDAGEKQSSAKSSAILSTDTSKKTCAGFLEARNVHANTPCRNEDLIIAFMGVTGDGKSFLIKAMRDTARSRENILHGFGGADKTQISDVMKAAERLIGDGESGPQAGPPSMGREDDDDDDCVGFHKFSRLNRSSKMVEKGAQLRARLNICNLHTHSKCATIPKYGPPKRDPVAAAIIGTVRQSLDASTLSTWRDVISRTCGEGADLYSANAKVLQGSSWQSAVPYCQLSTTS